MYLVVEVIVLARVGHEWSRHRHCVIDVEFLHGGPLGLEGCSPAAYTDGTKHTVTHSSSAAFGSVLFWSENV